MDLLLTPPKANIDHSVLSIFSKSFNKTPINNTLSILMLLKISIIDPEMEVSTWLNLKTPIKILKWIYKLGLKNKKDKIINHQLNFPLSKDLDKYYV